MKARTEEDLRWSRIVGEQIYCRRMDKGLTQVGLAKAAGVGVTTLVQIEAGNYVAKSNTLYRIARALSCDIGFFFGPIRAAEHATF